MYLVFLLYTTNPIYNTIHNLRTRCTNKSQGYEHLQMKKLLIVLFVSVFAANLNAQEAPFYFVPNENGTIEITGEITTDAPAARSYTDFKNAFVSWVSGYHSVAISSEQENKSFVVDGVRNSKTSYNPFSGGFFENICYKLYLEFNDNSVTYRISNLDIRHVYQGFGSKQEQVSVIKKIEETKGYQAGMENEELSKKERKEQKENFEEASESLKSAYEALYEYVIDAMKAINN